MRADSNTYMKLRARSHERPMTMKCWLWCQRKVCNDDADSCFTRVVAYRPALVCRKASRLRHARSTRSPYHTSPCRRAPKRLPSPDAPQSPLFGLNRKDYSPFVPHGLGKARIFVLIQTKSGVFDTVGHVCPAHTGSECTRCTYAHTHTHFPVQLLVTQVGFRCSAAPPPTSIYIFLARNIVLACPRRSPTTPMLCVAV
mgnify:CR=1 FL=1